jgi:energy-converting hydrogenase B subunit A
MILKRIFYAIFYVLDLVYNILKSALDVVILSLKGGISPQVVEVRTKLKKPISHLFLANSITLTPGTVTIDVKSGEQKLIVAALTPRTTEDIIPFESLIGGIFE